MVRTIPTLIFLSIITWEPMAAEEIDISEELEALKTRVGMNKKWLKPMLDGSEYMPFFPHRAQTGSGGVIPDHQFAKNRVCSSCHEKIYQQWQESIMSKSWDDPIYRALLSKTSKATDGAMDNFCTGCHTPVGLTTGKINSTVTQAARHDVYDQEANIPGVGCEACHNMTSRTGLDNGAYVLQPYSKDNQRTVLGPRPGATLPYHQTEYSEFHTRSDFCAPCHNVTHPFSYTPIERTYDEWLESPYSQAQTDCQDCHMPTFSGKSAVMGPDRKDIASHYFVGANVTLHKFYGDEAAVLRAKQLLKTAGAIEIVEANNLKPGYEAHVKVKVSNKNTGHKLPTGFPEGREVWIDFQVTDAEGKEIYALGKVKDGQTEPGTKNFKVWLGDKNGNVVDLKVWEVDRILKDNRLLPKGYEIVEYIFTIPNNAKEPFQVSAKLNYWGFSQKLVDELLGENTISVEISEIDSDTRQ